MNLPRKLILQILYTPQEEIRHSPEPCAIPVGNRSNEQPKLAGFLSPAIPHQRALGAQSPRGAQQRCCGRACNVLSARVRSCMTVRIKAEQEAIP